MFNLADLTRPTVNRTLILKLSLIIWIIFSCTYIAHDLWQNFYVSQMQKAYQQGQSSGETQTILKILDVAETCQPVNLFAEERQIDLIGVNCLSSLEYSKTKTPQTPLNPISTEKDPVELP